jgi:outer membrane receptor protein involved in Fe transport
LLLFLLQNEPEKPPPLHQVMVVTAERSQQELAQAASLVSVLNATDILKTPALTLDDQLRRVPGFSLFRRTSSLVAHPTTQGVSLRGIGPSGAGRSLVLFNGIPLNDPFGGWVYWNRIPPPAVESVEVVRGAASQLYGSAAMGGAIQLFSPRPGARVIEVRQQYGTHSIYDTAILVSEKPGRFGYTAAGRVFGTDGFHIVAEPNRGAIDIPARSAFQTLLGRLEYGDFHVAANFFHEKRGNGTRLQNNSSHMTLIDVGYRRPSWSWNFYGQPGLFQSTFSAIGARRATETLAEVQRTPTAALGSAFSFSRRRLVGGADWRYARAMSRGQNFGGVFLQDRFALAPRVDLLAGIRLDTWQNQSTHATVNPRAGFVVRAAESVTLRAAGYRGFRAPTLNEIYRPFRAGNVLTIGNPGLGEERLWGAEAGADVHPRGWFLLRVNGFWNSLANPVANVTVSSTPSLILRQRRNLGGARVKGFEAEAQARPGDRWHLRAGWLYSDARVENSSLRLVQTARHQGSVGVTWFGPVTVTLEGRAYSKQFDDDLNRLPLGGYPVFDFSVRRALLPAADLFFAMENALGRPYAVARTPVEQLGTPRLIHGGVRFHFRGK